MADQEQREIEQAIREENPDISDQEFGRERRTRSGARAEAWQQATVEEIISKLQAGISS